MDRRVRIRQLRCTVSGNEQPDRACFSLAPKTASQLEGNQAAHAVAEKAELFVKIRRHDFCQLLDQASEISEGRFS